MENTIADPTQALFFEIAQKDLGFTDMKTFSHDPSPTVEEWRQNLVKENSTFDSSQYICCKNLFLREKKNKKEVWLCICEENTKVDLNNFSKTMGFGSGNVRFAPSEVLLEYLSVEEGHLSPFALFWALDDTIVKQRKEQNKSLWDSKVEENIREKINIFVDSTLWNFASDSGKEGAGKKLLFHPLRNTKSCAISVEQLEFFMKLVQTKKQKCIFNFSSNSVAKQL